MKKIYLLIFIVFTTTFGQNNDKLGLERDFEKSRVLIDEMSAIDPKSADSLANVLYKLAKKSNSFKLKAKALSSLAFTKIYLSKEDIAFELNTKSIQINRQLNNQSEIAYNYFLFGKYYQNKSNYLEATAFFLKSLEISINEKKNNLIQKNYRSLATINLTQEKFEQSYYYIHKAQKHEFLAPSNNDKADNYNILANYYVSVNNPKLAEVCYKKALYIYTKDKKSFRKAWVLAESSSMYEGVDPVKQLQLLLEAQIDLNKVAPNNVFTYDNIGNIGIQLFEIAKNDSLVKQVEKEKIFETAKNKIQLLNDSEYYLKRSIENTQLNKRIMVELFLSGVISELQAYKNDYKNAYSNLQLNFKLNDSLFSQKNKNAIAKLEAEKEILELKSKNEKKATLNKVLIGSSIGLLLLGFLGYRNFKTKQKLQSLKISELEKDKQLLTIDAMLKGQEEERSRIAKDLHDGLGGLLSGTKLSFTNMKENLLLTTENEILFEKSLSMLDNTILDLRKVAHNLMPEALVKFGLNDALKDFCSSIQSSSNLVIDYQKIGFDRKLGNTSETFIYRIIQELVNNAVKHSKASEVLVQIAYTENKIIITVEDNGEGYDKNSVKTGDGLDNINYRVKYLSGSIDIVTSINNGTAVNIELNA